MTATMDYTIDVPINGHAIRVPLALVHHLAPAQDAPAAPAEPKHLATTPQPEAAPRAARRSLRAGFNFKSLIGSVLMIPGLGMSAWSMYGYIRDAATAPVWVAAGASSAFDGMGLFAALMAHEAAKRNRRSYLARPWVYLSVASSTIINWAHASTHAWPLGIHLMLAAPALLAAGAFELILEQTRANEREKRDPRRRTRRAAKVDFDLYLRHPLLVWNGRQDEARARLRDVFPATAGYGVASNSWTVPGTKRRRDRDHDADQSGPRDQTGTATRTGDQTVPAASGTNAGTGTTPGTNTGTTVPDQNPAGTNTGTSTPGTGTVKSGTTAGTKPRFGTTRPSRSRTGTAHVAGTGNVPDAHRPVIARVTAELRQAGEPVNRKNLSTHLREHGVRVGNSRIAPYLDYAKALQQP